MLKVIEKNNERVLTTAQIAETYGTDAKVVSYNFNYNKSRFTEGKHYFVISGEERRDFLLNNREIHDSSKHAKFIYLWTAKGALLHAKSLGTDEAWEKYEMLVDDYFKKVEQIKEAQPHPEVSTLSPLLQVLVQIETRQNAFEARVNAYETQMAERTTAIEEVKEAVTTISDNMTATPDHTKVVSTVNEYARWTRLGHNEVYNKVYDLLKGAHGIDVKQRVENERDRIQSAYHDKTGKWYSESTLKSKVNGIDVMVRLGCLDKFNTILVGLLTKEKAKSNLRLVQ